MVPNRKQPFANGINRFWFLVYPVCYTPNVISTGHPPLPPHLCLLGTHRRIYIVALPRPRFIRTPASPTLTW